MSLPLPPWPLLSAFLLASFILAITPGPGVLFIVARSATQGRRVTEFLGLTWHPNQARYYETARRKVVFAPTYHDVTQPVYRRAVGRWERYAEALAPLQDRLTPYCRAFGYAV